MAKVKKADPTWAVVPVAIVLALVSAAGIVAVRDSSEPNLILFFLFGPLASNPLVIVLTILVVATYGFIAYNVMAERRGWGHVRRFEPPPSSSSGPPTVPLPAVFVGTVFDPKRETKESKE